MHARHYAMRRLCGGYVFDVDQVEFLGNASINAIGIVHIGRKTQGSPRGRITNPFFSTPVWTVMRLSLFRSSVCVREREMGGGGKREITWSAIP
jgi:hypothetical protein